MAGGLTHSAPEGLSSNHAARGPGGGPWHTALAQIWRRRGQVTPRAIPVRDEPSSVPGGNPANNIKNNNNNSNNNDNNNNNNNSNDNNHNNKKTIGERVDLG